MQVVCHRGANALAPENSYASALYCIEWGADYLEIDVNTSRDGVMYVFHGPDLARTTNGTGKIYERDSAYIDALDCGSWFDSSFEGETVPRLDDFLGWLDGRIKVFFDVKWAPLPELVSMVCKHGLASSSFFWFGRDKLAMSFLQLAPELLLKINVTLPEQVEPAVQNYNARIVEFQLTDPVERIIKACRQAGVRSMIKYDGNDPDTFLQIWQTGVEMINLDHAEVFLRSC